MKASDLKVEHTKIYYDMVKKYSKLPYIDLQLSGVKGGIKYTLVISKVTALLSNPPGYIPKDK